MTRKRILVTGGAGFISSNVVRHLLATSPHEVVSLDALTYAGNMDNLTDVLAHERPGRLDNRRPGLARVRGGSSDVSLGTMSSATSPGLYRREQSRRRKEPRCAG